MALAVVRYLGAQLTEYHWNAFKSSAPQAATENAMFFMRLAIQRSPAGHHMSMEGTLDELLIKGELHSTVDRHPLLTPFPAFVQPVTQSSFETSTGDPGQE